MSWSILIWICRLCYVWWFQTDITCKFCRYFLSNGSNICLFRAMNSKMLLQSHTDHNHMLHFHVCWAYGFLENSVMLLYSHIDHNHALHLQYSWIWALLSYPIVLLYDQTDHTQNYCIYVCWVYVFWGNSVILLSSQTVHNHT